MKSQGKGFPGEGIPSTKSVRWSNASCAQRKRQINMARVSMGRSTRSKPKWKPLTGFKQTPNI